MFASFRKYFLLCLCTLIFLSGCDNEKTLSDDVGKVVQATLPGEGGAGGAGACQTGTDNGRLCDADNNPCTIDRCDAGTCTFEADVDCSAADVDKSDCDTLVCDPNNGACTLAAFEPATHACTDGADATDCTDDVCDGSGTCVSTPNAANCADDGVSCTDTICDAALGCLDVPDAANCADDGVGCTDTVCDTVLGCVDVPDAANCSGDAVGCTDTVCDPVLDCQDVPNAANCAGDGVSCTDTVCDPVSDCIDVPNAANCAGDGVSCTDTVCDPVSDCQDVADDSNCNDNVACTNDTCDEVNDCQFQPVNSNCNDNISCTVDTCHAVNGCQFAPNDSLCTDNNPTNCQAMRCSAQFDCQENVPITTPNPNSNTSYCNDQVGCTVNEFCQNGACIGRVDPIDDRCPDGPCFVGICDIMNDCQPIYATLEGELCRGVSAGNEACDLPEYCPTLNQPGYGTCPPDVFQAAGTPCSAASCASGLQTDQSLCDGTAVCPPANTVDCPGYACTSSATPVCQFECTTDEQCLGTHYCDTSGGTPGTCELRLSAGVSCADDTPCEQGDRCVDGVCCNSECSGQCQACDVAGFEGQCVPVTGAPHPGGPSGAERRPCNGDGSTCDGTCDGTTVSACVYSAVGTVCAGPSCDVSNSQSYESSTCDGDGRCVAPDPQDCSPFTCDGDACRGDCSQDSHCNGNQQCNGGVCVDFFDDGTRCDVASECASGYCIDGYCCESACSGQCEACNVSGSRGVCVPVEGEPEGNRPACGGSGVCAGSCDGNTRTRCSYPSTDTRCEEPSCDESSSEASLVAYCNGAGACPEPRAVECPDGCDGDLCALGECVVDADCESPDVCRAALCIPPADDGTTCTADAECESDNCIDGVCCDTTCGGQCEACDVEGSVGTCTAVDEGDQPHGARQPCTSDGTACGGSCDGSTRIECHYPDDGTCRPGDCTSGVATVEATCNGSGVCPATQEQDCLNFGCDTAGEVCDGDCADGSACPDGEYCSSGICVDLITDGTICAQDSQCESGNCVDGFCCNSACGSQCGACDVSGFEGICTAVSGAPHGARPACEGADGACGSQCDGQSVTDCAFPDGDTCGAATCNSGVVTGERICDGEGRCAAGEITRCDTLVCSDEGECSPGCEDDSDCPLTEICRDDNTCGRDPLIDAVDKGSCGCRIAGGDLPQEGGARLWVLLTPLAVLIARRRKLSSKSDSGRCVASLNP